MKVRFGSQRLAIQVPVLQHGLETEKAGEEQKVLGPWVVVSGLVLTSWWSRDADLITGQNIQGTLEREVPGTLTRDDLTPDGCYAPSHRSLVFLGFIFMRFSPRMPYVTCSESASRYNVGMKS